MQSLQVAISENDSTSSDAPELPVLLVFSDDWGRHPSSCQHLVSQLLDRYHVIWVNTIGMRTPSLNLATLKRGFEKMFQWVGRREQNEEKRPANLEVLNPRMWPWFTSKRDRRMNRRLLSKALTPVIDGLQSPVIAITTIPIVADLPGALPVDRWVYYCVDDFSVWPGLDQQTLLGMETDLIGRVDRIICVSETLCDRIASTGRETELLTHGVDPEFWKNPSCDMVVDEVRSSESPLIVFWGVVDRRMDSDFVRRLSDDLEHGTILLVGPEQQPDPELLSLPRVQRVPPMPFESLPALAAAADVLIMPYIDAEVTRAMQPLKLKEYLATGKPVVVRNLPSTRDWEDCLDLASTPEEFSRQVRQRLETGLPDEQHEGRRRLQHETWASKSETFEQLVLGTHSPVEAAS